MTMNSTVGKVALAFALIVLAHPCSGETTPTDVLGLADPLVGSAMYGGATYPGAALPFSLVKLSPDTTTPSTAGYNPGEPILGFSHTHIAGIGGDAFAGQLRVRPQTGPLVLPAPPSPKARETASPGYYSVELTRDRVRAELTSTERAGFHRYTFPADTPARVLVDLAATINNRTPEKPAGRCLGSYARWVADREVEGATWIRAGNARLTYAVYFVAEFDAAPAVRGVWLDGEGKPGSLEVTGGDNQPAGVYGEFAPGSTVGLRVGISYTDLAQARRNLAPAAGLNFDQVRARAEAIWRAHFSTIAVEGGTEAQRRQFYTALYHTVLTPTDATGDNARWTDDEQPVYWDIYTLWDTFRTSNPLLTLLYPDRQRGIIRSLLAVYGRNGWLPDAWAYNQIGIPFQGGTHADNVIADAFAKNLGGFDRELAYTAIRKNATEPFPAASKIFPNKGRLAPFFTLGYVPSTLYAGKGSDGKENEYSFGTSRTLEYAYNDFSVSQVAAALGKKEDAERFRKRSLGAYALFHPQKKLFWPKDAAGNWIADSDPTVTKMGWSASFMEGSAWQYRFSMPHDMQGLIDRVGGNDAFLALLDEYFTRNLHNAGNEPGFLTPWLHTYAGRPDKNVDRVRAIMAKDFKLSPNGYAGDEDTGAMSAWYLFAAMGFYPNAGQDVYLLASPVFSKVTMKLGHSGKVFVISAPNLSDANRYVQSASLNGKPWDQAWFRHGDLVGGAELVLQMGPKPSAWGTRSRPPSLTPAH